MSNAAEAPQDNRLFFLTAWKSAVLLAGPSLFSCRTDSPENASHWDQLSPKLPEIRKAIINMPRDRAVFIACMVSFFNANEGDKLMKKIGGTLGEAALVMKSEQRRQFSLLFDSYHGW